MSNSFFGTHIKIDALKTLTALIILQGLLCESILSIKFYIAFLEVPSLICISIFAVIELVQNKGNIKSMIYLAFPLIIGVYTMVRLSNKVFISLFLLMFFCNEETIEKVITMIYRITMVFFWTHFFLFFISRFLPIGLTDYVLYDELGVRYGLFTYHPNTIARIFIFYIALSCFVHKMEIPTINWIMIFITTIIMFVLTRSDALYLVGVCFLLSKVKSIEKVDKILTVFVKYGVIIFTGFSLSVALTASIPGVRQLLLQLNVLMSNRLTSNLRALELYGITLLGNNSVFGRNFVYQGVAYQWIYADNMYVYMMVHWGLIYLLLLAFLLFVTSNNLDYRAKAMVLVLLMYGIGENNVVNIYTSFPLLIAYSTIIKNDSEKISIYIGGR